MTFQISFLNHKASTTLHRIIQSATFVLSIQVSEVLFVAEKLVGRLQLWLLKAGHTSFLRLMLNKRLKCLLVSLSRRMISVIWGVYLDEWSASFEVPAAGDTWFNAAKSFSFCFLRYLCAVATTILTKKLMSINNTTVFQIEANERSHLFTWEGYGRNYSRIPISKVRIREK